MQWAAVVWMLASSLAAGAARDSAPGGENAPPRPNVLFLLTDDLRADAVGALGGSEVLTPNIDALVRRGFVFRNAYCLGSDSPAVCLPSRNMILSGRTYFRWPGRFAPADGPSLPAAFHGAGYESFHCGKRGNVAVEIEKLFQTSSYLDDQKERTSGQPGKAVVDRAIEWLDQRNRSKPFLMYLAFEAPHDPRVADAEYLELYDRERIALPPNYLPVHPFDNGEMTVRDERLAPWPRTEREIRSHLHEYRAVITGLDRHIGRLLEDLRRRGELDRTLVVFSSDHGLAIGSHGLMGKQNLYDAGMKAPLVFAGPGVPHGESEALVYLHDIFPTMCNLAGFAPPAGLDGASLAPIVRGESAAVRDSVFLAYRDVQRAVRDERYKLIRYPKIDRNQLFDLSEDPHETRDLAGDPSQARRIESLTARLREWQERLEDSCPLRIDSPASPEFTPPAD